MTVNGKLKSYPLRQLFHSLHNPRDCTKIDVWKPVKGHENGVVGINPDNTLYVIPAQKYAEEYSICNVCGYITFLK